MAGEMDKDELDLCRALCTRAGMLFEDASPRVILVGDLQGEELRSVIREARVMTARADAVLAAAEALIEQQA